MLHKAEDLLPEEGIAPSDSAIFYVVRGREDSIGNVTGIGWIDGVCMYLY